MGRVRDHNTRNVLFPFGANTDQQKQVLKPGMIRSTDYV